MTCDVWIEEMDHAVTMLEEMGFQVDVNTLALMSKIEEAGAPPLLFLPLPFLPLLFWPALLHLKSGFMTQPPATRASQHTCSTPCVN